MDNSNEAIDMDIESLTRKSGEWLRATGPESDIVMSSRIRLARNLAQFPFPARADDTTRAEIEERADALYGTANPPSGIGTYVINFRGLRP